MAVTDGAGLLSTCRWSCGGPAGTNHEQEEDDRRKRAAAVGRRRAVAAARSPRARTARTTAAAARGADGGGRRCRRSRSSASPRPTRSPRRPGPASGAGGQGRASRSKFFDPNFDSAKQVSQIQDAITSGEYQAFIVQANDGNAVVPAIQEAIEDGITVVAEFTPVGTRYDTIEPQVAG